jgi:hypothetical protein
MKVLRILICAFVLSGCVVLNHSDDKSKLHCVTKSAILNIARTSFLYGCVYESSAVKEKSLDRWIYCLDLAEKHAKTLEILLDYTDYTYQLGKINDNKK